MSEKHDLDEEPEFSFRYYLKHNPEFRDVGLAVNMREYSMAARDRFTGKFSGPEASTIAATDGSTTEGAREGATGPIESVTHEEIERSLEWLEHASVNWHDHNLAETIPDITDVASCLLPPTPWQDARQTSLESLKDSIMAIANVAQGLIDFDRSFDLSTYDSSLPNSPQSVNALADPDDAQHQMLRFLVRNLSDALLQHSENDIGAAIRAWTAMNSSRRNLLEVHIAPEDDVQVLWKALMEVKISQEASWISDLDTKLARTKVLLLNAIAKSQDRNGESSQQVSESAIQQQLAEQGLNNRSMALTQLSTIASSACQASCRAAGIDPKRMVGIPWEKVTDFDAFRTEFEARKAPEDIEVQEA